MVDFEGFKCDECNGVFPNTERTTQKTVFDGVGETTLPEEYLRDLCRDCLGKIDQKALRGQPRRKKKAKATPDPAPEPATA